MKSRLTALVGICAVVTVAGCGDDAVPGASSGATGDESGTVGESGSEESGGNTMGDGDGDAPGDGDGDAPGDGDGDPAGDGDGDPAGDGDGDAPGDGDGDASGDGDGDGSGDGDGDASGDGDGDGDGSGDGDGDGDGTTGDADDDDDGVPNMDDNCPADANPNQLDFDADGDGNVCDVQTFTMGGGVLVTTATASAGQGSCDIVLDLEILGGEVLVQLDDDAAVAGVEFVQFDLADIPEQDCFLAVVPFFVEIDATLAISNFVIANGGGSFPTEVGHNLQDHDNGLVDGDQDVAHPIQITGTLAASTDPNQPPAESPLDFPGQTPPAAVLVSNAGDNLELTFGDPNFIVLDEIIMSMDLPIDVNMVLTGLVGTVTMTP